MKILFIGAVEFSAKALQKLIELHANVVGVCTLEASVFNADHLDLTAIAQGAAIPVRYASDINSQETLEWISALKPDVVFCFGWSRLIKRPLLDLAAMGVVGYHPTLLPANRGRHPLIWALALGLRETGSTFFFMNEGADTGDILSQRVLPILAEDDAGSLYSRMTAVALSQIEEFLPLLSACTFVRRPQEQGSGNTWRKRGRQDGQIDWRMSALSIHNLVRGLTRPYVGAHFMRDGQDIRVWRTEITETFQPNLEPGKVLASDARGVVVNTGQGAIRLLQIEPSVNMSVGEYL
ncbi:MAG: formyl transferase [Hydrogenophilales bacterium 28-61-23]|nr:MAG: formyl transferase [Hydrogenophilales bacterium 28-61-23]